MNKFQGIDVGDRVRIVIESEVTSVRKDYVQTEVNCFDFDQSDIVSVEKVEPPVVQFQPGDVVGSRGDTYLRALGKGGYTILPTGEQFVYGGGGGAFRLEDFTSEHFEKIEVCK